VRLRLMAFRLALKATVRLLQLATVILLYLTMKLLNRKW
jgi:hypothetical protein